MAFGVLSLSFWMGFFEKHCVTQHWDFPRLCAISKGYYIHIYSLCLFLSSCVLSVVYEHHSKLEKSLQKERLEHKKAEEGNVLLISTSIDFLIYISHSGCDLIMIMIYNDSTYCCDLNCSIKSFIESQYYIDFLVFKRESQKALNKEKVRLKHMVLA